MKMKRIISISLPAVIAAICMLACFRASPADASVEKKASETDKVSDWKAPDQEEAKERTKEIVPFVDTYVDECLLCRKMRLREKGLGVKDIENSYFLLDSPIIKKEEDHYGPVRFMHSKHASEIDCCTRCHHYRPTDAEAKETTRCSACHQEPFRSDHPERIGLKAAYHLQCTGCHQELHKGPVECIGCHRKNVPDHKNLVKLPDNPEPTDVTKECLRCHDNAGEDMLATAHWLWRGPSTHTLDHRKEVRHGKGTTVLNNF